MGNDFSMGKKYAEAARYGNICVQTDKSTYFGGDTVTGKIYLNLLLPYPGNQIYLKLVGREHVHFVQQRTETKSVMKNGQATTESRQIDELFEESHEVIRMITPVYNWVTLMPGQYAIPFAFMLPGTLPSSFHQEGPRYLANISYKLEAILEPSFKSEPKLKFKQNFIVRQPVKSAMQGVGNEIRTNLTACCSSKGANTLRAKFERTYYSPGETAQVIMQLDNTGSQLNNTNIEFTLKQKIHLTARGKIEDRVMTKISRTLPGIQAGSASDSNLIAINLPAFQGGDYSKIKTFNLTHHLIHLNPFQTANIPQDFLFRVQEVKEDNNVLNCATKGKLISSDFFLEVSCPMDGCCAPTPAISCPIEIYYPEIQLVQVPIPANWAPQEIGCVNVSFNAGMPNMNVNIDMGGMLGGNMTVTNQQPQNGNVQMNVNMGMPNMTVQTTSSNQSFGQNDNVQMNVNMGMPNMTVTSTSSHHNSEHVEMNMGFGGMQVQQTTTTHNQGFGEHHNEDVQVNMNMGFGMPGMNMQVTHTESKF